MKSVLRIILLLLCWSSHAEAVNIAVVAPREGIRAKFGNELIEGTQIAVDLINKSGGVDGEQLNLIVIDDKCNDKFAISIAQMITLNSSKKEKVSLVIGPYCDNARAKISDIYAKAGIVNVLPMALSDDMFYETENRIFKLAGAESQQAKSFVKFFGQNFSGQNLAVVYDSKMPKTKEIALAVQNMFLNASRGKLTLYDVETYNKKYKKMAREILLNNNIVYVAGDVKSIASLVQRLQENKEDVKIFVDDYLATGYLFRELGNFAEGIYIVALDNLKDNPNFTEKLVELRLAGKEPRGIGVYGFAAVNLWYDAVSQAKSVDFKDVWEVGANGKFKLPWGNTGFENGRAKNFPDWHVYQIKNGEYTQAD